MRCNLTHQWNCSNISKMQNRGVLMASLAPRSVSDPSQDELEGVSHRTWEHLIISYYKWWVWRNSYTKKNSMVTPMEKLSLLCIERCPEICLSDSYIEEITYTIGLKNLTSRTVSWCLLWDEKVLEAIKAQQIVSFYLRWILECHQHFISPASDVNLRRDDYPKIPWDLRRK